jgi:multidrug resistance efflux pump
MHCPLPEARCEAFRHLLDGRCSSASTPSSSGNRIKLKWLPWNIKSQVIVAIIPIVGLTMLILLLNIYAPSSSDVRVFKYTVPIVSQVRGRVIEVPVSEGNVPVKKGDVLFRIDPTPYQLTVNQLRRSSPPGAAARAGRIAQ